MCRSLSRPSHSRPFNMHCPPRAQLLAVAYLGIIRMNSFFFKKRGSNGTTGREEKAKQHFKFINEKRFLFLLPIILRSRYTLVSSMPSALKSTPLGLGKACERGRLEKKFDLRKIKLVFCESFYAKCSSAVNVHSIKVKTKNRKVEAFSVVYRIYSEEHCPE